ncbi:MAG: BrnA antitoxin family protein [Methylobacter sp.]|nr:BrnA antitoxin family protein [Methylobacter sp.]
MKAEYDLSQMKSRKNPYGSKLKKSVTFRLGEDVVGYFKEMAEGTGVPYQSLINLYLRDCVFNSIGKLIFLGSQTLKQFNGNNLRSGNNLNR